MKTTPKLRIFAGKGGVGKSTCATAYAVYQARNGKRVALIDLDAGHSVYCTLGVQGPEKTNSFTAPLPQVSDLYVAVAQPTSFQSLESIQASGGDLDSYLEQFPGDQGLIAFNDMCREFFGLCIDINSLQNIINLLQLIDFAQSFVGAHEVVIDVEPTAGLKHLLSGVDTTARSVRNLSEIGILKMAAIGLTWPDIKGFLDGSYIAEADRYAGRLEDLARWMRQAEYSLVSIGEASPAQQTFDVRHLVEGYGGNVSRCILNNLRGEPAEAQARAILEEHGLPIVCLDREPGIQHDIEVTEVPKRIALLSRIGKKLSEAD